MLYIKARYMKDGVQHGREYAFGSDVIVKPGEVVSIGTAKAVVTAVDVPETEILPFREKLKKIDGKVEEE